MQTSPTGLYLIDMLDICQKDATAFTHEETKTRLSDRSQPQFGVNSSVGDISELRKVNKFLGPVAGVSQLMQDSPVFAKKFSRVRDFRSKDQVAQFPNSSTVDRDHDANGQCPQDHCRSSNPTSHHAVADPSATARETGDSGRDGDRERAGDSCSPSGHDATDSAARCHTGSPLPGSFSPKEGSRKEGETSTSGNAYEREFTGLRKFHTDVQAANSQRESAKEPGSVRRFSGCKLARDRSRGRNHFGPGDDFVDSQ